jgi:hypothetical protein
VNATDTLERHPSWVGATLLVNLTSGVVAGTIASVATHPFDVIKTRVMAARPEAAGAAHGMSTYTALKKMVLSEGPSALWRGLVSDLRTCIDRHDMQLNQPC